MPGEEWTLGEERGRVPRSTGLRSRQAALADAVRDAAERLRGRVIKTPVVRLPWLDAPSREVWAKLECWQHSGSFKYRGAANALLRLPPATPVVTASAGNHGLGVALSAQQLRLPCTVVVPVGASELKVRRLIGSGAEVIPAGRDLFAATQHARAEAERRGAHYVSGYADWDVVAGQGTCASDLGSEIGFFDSVLVPLGGGGLLAGMGAYLARAAPATRVVALHPSIFGRHLTSGSLVDELARPVVPSVADGLAVQLDHQDWTAPLIEHLTDTFVCVDERLIQLGTYALLQNQGLLVEGAGAIGVGALLEDLDGDRHTGKVLLVLSGGNISAAQLAQATATQVDDVRLRRLLGLRAVRVAFEVPRRPPPEPPVAPAPATPAPRDGEDMRAAVWEPVLANAVADLTALRSEVDRHRDYVAAHGLHSDAVVFEALDQQFRAAHALAESCLAAQRVEDVRARYRLLCQQIGFLRTALQWRSPSYDQSVSVMFFDPAEQRSAGVNYARYGSIALRDFEIALTRVLGFDPTTVELLATSSGMAAYQLVELFLTRDVLRPGDAVAYAPYVYFEAVEQIRSIPYFRSVVAPSYDVDDLIRTVEASDARVLMIDPMANCDGLPTVDLRELSRRVADRDWRDRWLVVDGTMVSGGVAPFEWFSGPRHPRVLYYESGSKYLQLGLDLQMAGVCAVPVDLHQRMFRLRRNSGTTMYDTDVARFPRYDRGQFLARMRVLTNNAAMLARGLREQVGRSVLQVGFPCDWEALGWQHGGGIVSATFVDPGLNNRDRLEGLIEVLLQECRRLRVPLTKGVSFGFSVTRVSASSAVAETADPFLRFAVGEESPAEMERLCAAITGGFQRFLTDG